MNPAVSVVICLAYIVGLLSTAISNKIVGIPAGGIGLLLLSIVIPQGIPQLRKSGLPTKLWLAAGFISLIATLYFTVRTPQPGPNDISRLIPPESNPIERQVAIVEGAVISTPRLTRSQKIQFWLSVTQLQDSTAESNSKTIPNVTGKLYVTAPLLQSTGIRPGQTVQASGQLYRPKAATNPGGFDFQAYLAQQGGFAGLQATQIEIPKQPKATYLSWWSIQRKIIRAQVQGLGVPEGPLVSSMVLGNRAVDLSYEIRDQFTQAGLAHALAASGFQVSLILSVLLSLTNRLPKKIQFGVGAGAIVIFLGLTGIQPSVLRASIMGIAALFALTIERKVKPLGSLLTAATLLLLFNPLWIWDLGFQFSFLATLGLLVTVPTLTKWLDWFPPGITALVTVSISAYVWTAPLQLYAFGMISPYAIPINILTTPLISFVSLGGVLSAVAAVIWPSGGSALAWLLYYPTRWLIELVHFSQQLPGVAISAGTLTALQLIVLYGIILLVWLNAKWHKRWWIAGVLSLALIVSPALWQQKYAQKMTVLAAADQPILVVQNKGQTILFSSINERTARLTVQPFLQREGINRLVWGVALDSKPNSVNGWKQIFRSLAVNTFLLPPLQPSPKPINTETLAKLATLNPQFLVVGQPKQMGSITLAPLSAAPSVLQLSFAGQTWMYVDGTHPSSKISPATPPEITKAKPIDVLWGKGNSLTIALLEKLQPRVAIAAASSVSPEVVAFCQKHQIQLYWTGRDGALQWSPGKGFKGLLNYETDVFS